MTVMTCTGATVPLPPSRHPSHRPRPIPLGADLPRKGFPHGLRSMELPIRVKNGPQTVILLKANVASPEVLVSHEELDFDSVLVGQSKSKYLQVAGRGTGPASASAVAADPCPAIRSADSSFPSCASGVAERIIPPEKKSPTASLLVFGGMGAVRHGRPESPQQ